MSKWQPQDIVRDADDVIWVRSAVSDEWKTVTYLLTYSASTDPKYRHGWFPHDAPKRPLLLLVRNGESVPADTAA